VDADDIARIGLTLYMLAAACLAALVACERPACDCDDDRQCTCRHHTEE